MKRYLIFFLLFAWLRAEPIAVPVSLTAAFVQKITTPGKRQTRYTGIVRLNRSREFLWKYTEPSRREICGDGSKIKIIDHDLKQVTVYKAGSLLDPMQLLKRAKLYRESIYTARYHGTHYTLKTNAEGQLEQIAFKDNLDNIVNLHFYKIHYGEKPINTARLRCHIPKSYDVIKG